MHLCAVDLLMFGFPLALCCIFNTRRLLCRYGNWVADKQDGLHAWVKVDDHDNVISTVIHLFKDDVCIRKANQVDKDELSKHMSFDWLALCGMLPSEPVSVGVGVGVVWVWVWEVIDLFALSIPVWKRLH